MSKVILIADDEPKNMKLIRDLLQVSGYSVIEATDGSEAVELARNMKPDLVLMDIHMPMMNGLQATRLLKTDPQTQDIPVLALTASVGSVDQDKVFEAGCDAFIPKPIEIKSFLITISTYLTGGC